MKRLFSIFGVTAMVLLGLATPHAAHAACKNADGTTGNGTWPSHQYTQTCGTATVANGTQMFDAFSPWSTNDAVDRLTFQKPIFYLFNDPTEFLGAGIKPTETMTTQQRQTDLGITFYPNYTVIFQETDAKGGTATSNWKIQNVTAHEAGHWVDMLYEVAPNAAYIVVGGTKRTGDMVSVTITNTHVVGSPLKVTYTVGETDTLADIAAGLASAINQTAALNTSSVHIVASSSGDSTGNYLDVDSVLPNGAAITSYTTAGTSYAVSVGMGDTETLTATVGVLPGSGVNMSSSMLFADEVAQDWTNFNALSACGGSDPGNGIFSGRQDKNNVYFCGGTKGGGGSLEAPYNNTTNYPNNKAILIDKVNNATYGDIFGANNEILPEEFAVAVSKTDDFYTNGPKNNQANPYSTDYYFEHAFQCTQALVGVTTEAGVLPTTEQWPSTCPKH